MPMWLLIFCYPSCIYRIMKKLPSLGFFALAHPHFPPKKPAISSEKNDFSSVKHQFSPVASSPLGGFVLDRVTKITSRRKSKMATAKKAPAKKAAPAKKPAAKKAAPVKKVVAKKAPAKKRTPNAAFMKAMTPSAALAAVIGATPVPRTEVVSKLWIYIKKHGLQDSVNKRNINADEKLKAVFGKKQVTMFELAGLIGKHLS
jgi:chromatin remodeling complex protein RSC6